jgi:acyl-coenzyme A synthetase/AMP-(fatty) acid ligase
VYPRPETASAARAKARWSWLPLPPGCLPTLWDADERYVESYTRRYPGYYLTADGGYKDGTVISSSWDAPTT